MKSPPDGDFMAARSKVACIQSGVGQLHLVATLVHPWGVRPRQIEGRRQMPLGVHSVGGGGRPQVGGTAGDRLPEQDVARSAGAQGWDDEQLTRIDNPNPHTIGLFGPAPDAFNRDYAMSTDLTKPVIVAYLLIDGVEPSPLLIDGTHRLYRAWREGVP